MYHGGLILEGGGMRGVYTAGVLDAFLENDIKFEKIYGVSAGSCHACSYMSRQYGRAFRVAVDYLDDPDYCGTRTFLRTGNIFGVDMLYSRIPNVLDPFDFEAYKKYPGTLYAVITDVDTGEPVYVKVKDLNKQMWAIRASSSLPLVSKSLVVNGHTYLDGGVADSIPIRKSLADGNTKNVVILTREEGYQKEPNRAIRLLKMRYPKSKAFVKKMANRHIRYNDTLAFLEKEEEEGRVFLIRPKEKVNVGRVEKNRSKLEALYQIGLEDGRNSIAAMKEYLER